MPMFLKTIQQKKQIASFAIFCFVFGMILWIYGQNLQRAGYIRSNTIETNRESGLCDVVCRTGTPCEYKDELDFRIIVITYKRPNSLEKCLSHISDIDTRGDRVGVDIWIDRGRDGSVDEQTLNISRDFSQSWTKGRVCVHVQERNAYIMGQWIDSWRPKPNTTELALILEDDIDISPLAYRWLKTVNNHFKTDPGIAGYAIQMENIQTKRGQIRRMQGPASDLVYLYAPFATWGFSPNPDFWRQFQDWFHQTRDHDKEFRPYVPGIISTKWYMVAERQHKQDSVWEMWFTYFCNANKRLTVHPNLLAYTGRQDVLLDTNRMEKGLHYTGKGRVDSKDGFLLREWDERFEIFPEHVQRYGYGGELL